MNKMNTLVSSVFENKDNLSAVANQAVMNVKMLLTDSNIDLNDFNEFLTAFGCEFETAVFQFIAKEILEMDIYAHDLMIDTFEDFLYADIEFIIENNLQSFDKNLIQFFKNLVDANFVEAEELLPNLRSDFSILCTYGEHDWKFEDYMSDIQNKFSNIDLIEDLAEFNRKRDLHGEISKLIPSNKPNGKIKI
jgi:hypothetical protein